jgi:hypothetical protein
MSDQRNLDEELEREAELQDAAMSFRRRRTMASFRYDEAQAAYWDIETGMLLCAKSVDGAIRKDDWPTRENSRGELVPYPPSNAINDVETGWTVEGSTWWPGMPQFVRDFVMTDRGMQNVPGAVCLNTYVPGPGAALAANGQTADRWVEHVRWLYEEEAEIAFDFFAHLVQRPYQKCNFGLVLAGAQGIGKDSLLAPIRACVGEFNAAEIGPDEVFTGYNGYAKSLLLVINEVRPDPSEHKASTFYDKLKPVLAAPPDLLAMTKKYENTVYIRNLCRVILTTNDPLSMYIPAEDRRLCVLTSSVGKRPAAYYEAFWDYLRAGGCGAAVQWLAARDLSAFSPTAAPAMTLGKEAVIGCAEEVRRNVLDDVLDAFIDEACGGVRPDVIFSTDLTSYVSWSRLFDNEAAARDALKSKSVPFKLAERGYDRVNSASGDGRWKRNDFRSRSAYIVSSAPRNSDARRKLVEQALWRRPIAFGAAVEPRDGSGEVVEMRSGDN